MGSVMGMIGISLLLQDSSWAQPRGMDAGVPSPRVRLTEPGRSAAFALQPRHQQTVVGRIAETFSATNVPLGGGRVEFYVREDSTGLYYQFIQEDEIICSPIWSSCRRQEEIFSQPVSRYLGLHVQITQRLGLTRKSFVMRIVR
jgi:hypothetical protein